MRHRGVRDHRVLAAPGDPADGAKANSNSSKTSEITYGVIDITGNYPEAASPPGLFGELHEGLADGRGQGRLSDPPSKL